MDTDPIVPTISKAARIIVFIAFSIVVAGSLGVFTWKMIVPAVVRGSPPATWNWRTISLFELGLTLALAWLGVGIYKRFSTQLTSNGVSASSLRGRLFILWSQVEQVKVEGHEIKLFGHGTSITVNVFCFSNPKQVGRFISDRLSTQASGKNAA